MTEGDGEETIYSGPAVVRRIQQLERRMLELEQRRLLDKRDAQGDRLHPNLDRYELSCSSYQRLKAIEERAQALRDAMGKKKWNDPIDSVYREWFELKQTLESK